MHIAPSHLSRALKSLFAAVFAFFALIAVSTPMTHAAPGVRANVTYQARLMDASGYPVADGVYQVEFSLYDAPVAGNRLWTADGTVGAPLPVNVTVQDGLFTVLLGDGVTQLPFGDIDWNSDSLYLGVTIGADGEMSPRRPITAVPQAINSAQLGGMSASSSDTYGGESQFTILQASTTAATSTRSALDVRSNGTSVANDFIFRAISSTGLPLFTINSQGTVSTTDLLVDGIAVCRADGTDCLPVASGTSTLQEVYDEGNAITLGNNAFELTAIASGTNLLPFFGVEGYASFVAKGFGEGGLALVHASSSVGPTTTYMYFTSDVNDPINGTSSYIASQMQTGILRIAANSELGLTAENQGNISLQTVGGNIILNSATTTLQSNLIITGDVASDFNPFTDDTYSLGTPLLRWNGYFSGVTTTFLSVAGQSVCLEDGTNCPVAGASTLQDAYDNGNTIVTADGAIQLVAASTTLVGADLYSHLITGTFTSGTNEGIDFSLFANSSNPYLSGTGTSFIYREDRTLQPGLTTSSGIGFSNDDTENFLTLFTVRPSGPSQNITFDNNGITHFPGAGATTTFAQNVALEATARVDSDLIPRYDGVFSLGTSTERWNAELYTVTSSFMHLAAEPGFPPYDGVMLVNSASQGQSSGLDFVSIADGSNDGMLLLYREDRTINDSYAEILMNQTSADGFHRMLFEVKEGADENDIQMTPTSTTIGGDVLPKASNIFWLGSSDYRWNGYFETVTTSNLLVGGQSVCLENGVNCPVIGAGTLQDAYDGSGIGEGRTINLEGGPVTLQWYASGTDLIGSPTTDGYASLVSKGFGDEGFVLGHTSSSDVTSTFMFFTSDVNDPFNATTSYIFSEVATGDFGIVSQGNIGLYAPNQADIRLQASGGEIVLDSPTTTLQTTLIMMGEVASQLVPDLDDTYLLGTSALRWNGFFSNVTTTNLTVGGQSVCLENGTNCPAGSGTLQTAYDGTGIGEGRTIEVEGGPVILQGYASGTNTLAPLFPTYEGYNHFVMLGASSSQSGLAMGSMRLGGVATGTYIAFANDVDDLSADGVFMYGTQDGDFSLLSQNGSSSTSLNVTPDGFLINGTSTFNGLVSITDGLTVGGVNVCLQNGTNCPAGGGDLQDAYDAGRFITLDDGRIDLTAAFGTPDDFTFSVRGSPIDHTKVFGAGSAYDANVGFDISITQDGNTTGTLFTFTNDRNNPESSLSSAYLSHEVFDTGSSLTIGNATVTIALSEDSVSMSAASATLGLFDLLTVETYPFGNDAAFKLFNLTPAATEMIRLDNTLSQNVIHLLDDNDPNGLITPSQSGDLLIRSLSTGGPNTNLYINTDGTDSGWVGVVTEDSLNSHSLQEAYDIGTSIDTGFGPFTLFTSTTAPDLFPAFPWVDAYRTLVSEGFTNDGIGFTHGSGTWDNQHFIEFFANESLPPGSTSSSYIMGDTVSGTLNIISTNDLFLEAVLDEIVLTSATTTFNSNIVLSGSNYVGSDLVPFTTDLYDLGSSSRRWNEVYAQGVSSTVLSLVTGTLGHDYSVGPISARSVLETSHVPGGVEGFDIANFTLGGTVTGTALFTTANRNAGAPFSAVGLSGVTSTGLYSYHSPSEASDMFIFSQGNNKGTFIRMTDEDVTVRGGQGASSTGGRVELQGVSTTAPAVTFRNATSSLTGNNWDMYARHVLIGASSTLTGVGDFNMVIGYDVGGLCLDDVNNGTPCPAAVSGSIFADGTITADAFDLAETYESPDMLEPGDIVVASTVQDMQVIRSSNTSTLPMGIISSDPGLLLGRQATGSHPVALAGRVPTKVSTINGEIKTGDLLAPTSIPGVAGKAIEDGPIVGIALQSYNGADVGKIEVFVKTSWYSKPNNIDQVVENNTYITNVVASEPDVVRRGLAKIETGAVKVRITFETLNGYPFVQTTPRGLIVGAWSTDNYTDTGFDIILEQPQTFDVVFGWEARALDGSTMMIMSDGTSLLVDPTSGQVVVQEPEPIEEEPSTPSEPPAPTPVGETEPDPVPEPAPEPEPTPEPAPEPAPSPEPSNP